jgi:hypothetical protein
MRCAWNSGETLAASLFNLKVSCATRRLGSSLKANLTYYLAIGLAGVVGIGLLLISGRLHAGDLLPLAMLLSNTYGSPCLLPLLLKPCMHCSILSLACSCRCLQLGAVAFSLFAALLAGLYSSASLAVPEGPAWREVSLKAGVLGALW